MPLLNEKEYNTLFRELDRDYTRHFKIDDRGLQFGSHWSDVAKAAFLLCNKWFWGNDRKQRAKGPTVKYPPAILKLVEKRINPASGIGGCVFHVEGEPNYLVTLLQYHDQGMLFADRGDRPGGWDFERDRLLSAILSTREKALRMREGFKVVSH